MRSAQILRDAKDDADLRDIMERQKALLESKIKPLSHDRPVRKSVPGRRSRSEETHYTIDFSS